MVIKLPRRVSSNYEGYNSLVKLYQKSKGITFDTVIFDFASCTWFEANLCSVLGSICNKLEFDINTVKFIKMNSSIEKIFRKNEFLKHFGGESIDDVYQTTIKYRRYKSTEQSLFKEYLNKELLSKDEMPEMSMLLQKKINESIFEIFENAITHGNSKYVFSCGQYYPNKTPPRIDFTIVDLGNTIKANVNNFLGAEKSGAEAIEWAVKAKNTTKTGNTPGGLGLKVIREFLKMNKGKMQIASGDGFWSQDKNSSTFVRELEDNFEGTIVNLEFNIEDSSSYILSEEVRNINNENIF